MTPNEVTAILRQFNNWCRDPSDFPASPMLIEKAIDAAIEVIDRLEATEKERDKLKELNSALCTKSNSQVIHNARLAEENDALRAKVERMERQEPVTAQQRFQRRQEMMAVWLPWQTTELRKGRPARTVDVLGLNVEYRELYALPGAKGEEK